MKVKQTFLSLALALPYLHMVRGRLEQQGDEISAPHTSNPRADDRGDKSVNNFNIKIDVPKKGFDNINTLMKGI